MKKSPTIIVLLILAVLLLAWSPWITKNYAENKAVQAFEKSQEGIIDGCGFNCDGCGVISSQKMPFIYTVEVAYLCGLLDPREMPTPAQNSIWITPIGITIQK